MLTLFRSAMDGPFKWVFVILLVAAFAVVGVPAIDNFGNSAAVTVGKQSISARDVELELRNQVARLQQQNPEITREQALAAGLGQQVISTLTAQALVSEEASRLGLVAPVEVVRRYVENLPVLQNPETGQFDAQRLGLLLQQEGLSESAFGELVTEGLLREQLVSAVSTPAPAPQELTRLLLLRQFEARDVKYAEWTLAADDQTFTDDEIASFYAANISRYQSPEYRVFTVVTVGEDDVADAIEVSDDEVRQLYNVRLGAADAMETRTLRQFRVSTEQLDAVKAALAGEGGFDEAADAVGAKVTTLTDQREGDFIAEAFGDAVFAADEGGVVGPVETPFGWLVAQVDQVNRTETPDFETEREALEAELRAEIAEDRLVDLIDELEIARDEGASLAEAAEEVGLMPRTTAPTDAELFTINGSIADLPAALAAAGRGLAEGEESNAIRLQNDYGFIAVEEIIPAAPLPLDEVRAQIETALKAEKQANAASLSEERFNTLRAEGMTFDEAASMVGGETKIATISLSDEERALPDPAFSAAFELPVGQRDLVSLAEPGQVAMVEVTAVRFQDASQAQDIIPLVADQFGQQISGELEVAYLDALREGAVIKQNAQQLARGLGQVDP